MLRRAVLLFGQFLRELRQKNQGSAFFKNDQIFLGPDRKVDLQKARRNLVEELNKRMLYVGIKWKTPFLNYEFGKCQKIIQSVL